MVRQSAKGPGPQPRLRALHQSPGKIVTLFRLPQVSRQVTPHERISRMPGGNRCGLRLVGQSTNEGIDDRRRVAFLENPLRRFAYPDVRMTEIVDELVVGLRGKIN